MQLVENWRAIVRGAYSFWLPLIGLALEYAPQVVPFIPDGWLPWWVAPLVILGGPIFRLVKQKSVSGPPPADDEEVWA